MPIFSHCRHLTTKTNPVKRITKRQQRKSKTCPKSQMDIGKYNSKLNPIALDHTIESREPCCLANEHYKRKKILYN